MSEPLRLLLAGYVSGFASALALVLVVLLGLLGSPPPTGGYTPKLSDPPRPPGPPPTTPSTLPLPRGRR